MLRPVLLCPTCFRGIPGGSGIAGGLILAHLQDGALGLSLEVGENRLVMGGLQQLYHLDTYIPLRINCDESKAAFHQKRKVPWGAGGLGKLGTLGGLDSWI